MANYFRLDTSLMHETNCGGRLYSGITTTEIPNGVLFYLGGYTTGSTEVRTLLTPTTDLIKSGIPVIVAKPEINYDEHLSTDYAIGIFRNPANKPVPVVQFSLNDGIDLSEDYFDLTGKTGASTKGIEVGDVFAIQANAVAGTQLKYSATAPDATTAKVYFKVIGVKNSSKATYVASNGNRFPQPYKMIKLAVMFN